MRTAGFLLTIPKGGVAQLEELASLWPTDHLLAFGSIVVLTR
jgi:hypothetical protein